jgi:ribosomal protein S18 acetylase RimI-like enzyme
VEIRALVPGDEELLARAVRMFRDLDAVAPDLFLEDPRAHVFVAIDGDAVIGWCHGYELLRPEGRWTMVMQQIDVAPEHRRERVGRQLLDAFVALARSKGHQRMWLLTDAGNEVARRLYEGAGRDAAEQLGFWWVFG